jgi:hypothetical protein
MGKLTIVRGLPGSGKSTYARKLAAETGAVLVEPDALLVEDGTYNYTPGRYGKAVDVAHAIVEACACIGADCIYADVLPTVVDVCFVARNYLPFARRGHRPRLEIVEMPSIGVEESLRRNRHGVRPEDVARMAERWEHHPDAVRAGGERLERTEP